MDNEFKITGCLRGFSAKGCGRQDKQLNTYDYLAGIPGNVECCDLVEVQFKHTRKGYYRNDNHLPLEKGDIVAVEASPGHDIGTVTLTGQLVPLQMKKANLKPGTEIKRIYRKARQVDLDKYEESKALEQGTMIRSRQIAKELNLNMKIGDVEYQGDGNKAIFYYIADARVDFRQLIKVLADAFHVRIEMKQIGARQEAGRIGGIGPCGRELCCATWMKNFNSVSTTAARFQDISPNPQKLAGQCAKLKCCLNYEVDAYVEAGKKLPQRDVVLETADATYYLFKVDILAGLVTYSTDRRLAANLVTLSAERAHEIIRMNREGERPISLNDDANKEPARPVDLVEQEDLHRFDKAKRRKNNKRKGNGDSRRNNRAEREGKDNVGATAAPKNPAEAGKSDAPVRARQEKKRPDNGQEGAGNVNSKGQGGAPANNAGKGQANASNKTQINSPVKANAPANAPANAQINGSSKAHGVNNGAAKVNSNGGAQGAVSGSKANSNATSNSPSVASVNGAGRGSADVPANGTPNLASGGASSDNSNGAPNGNPGGGQRPKPTGGEKRNPQNRQRGPRNGQPNDNKPKKNEQPIS